MTPARLLLALILSFAACMPASSCAQVDINHADARTLAEGLDGVGLVRAEAIIAYRDRHGPFRSVEELDRVHGIGAKIIDANRDQIVIVGSGLRPVGKPAPSAR